MKYLTIILLCLFALLGCSFHRQQNDLADNQYYEKEKHADFSAPYIGVWAVETIKWRKILKIKSNGIVKVVLSPGLGAIEGLVYLEQEKPFLILKDGTKSEIVRSGEGYLLINSYGKKEKLASFVGSKRIF